jgi:hypothetical protein
MKKYFYLVFFCLFCLTLGIAAWWCARSNQSRSQRATAETEQPDKTKASSIYVADPQQDKDRKDPLSSAVGFYVEMRDALEKAVTKQNCSVCTDLDQANLQAIKTERGGTAEHKRVAAEIRTTARVRCQQHLDGYEGQRFDRYQERLAKFPVNEVQRSLRLALSKGLGLVRLCQSRVCLLHKDRKMDQVNAACRRLGKIVTEVRSLLKQAGIDDLD